MNNHLLTKIKKYLVNHEKRVKYYKIFVCLASIVTFFTVYALIMPAITLEDKLVCEKEEHVHNENCYTDEFICEDTEENRNNDECYQLVLTCSKEKHQHTEDCYTKVLKKNNEISLDNADNNITNSITDIPVNYAIRAGSVISNITVYSVNHYDNSGSYNNVIMAYSNVANRTIAQAINTGMGFNDWLAIVVEKQNNNYVVTNIVNDRNPKKTLVVPQNGFILLLYDNFYHYFSLLIDNIQRFPYQLMLHAYFQLHPIIFHLMLFFSLIYN